MPTLSEETIRRLRATVEAMKANPTHVNMQSERVPTPEEGRRGTPGCLFGWACHLFEPNVDSRSAYHGIYKRGALALAMPEPNSSISLMTDAYAIGIRKASEPDRLAAALFFPNNWPPKFESEYEALHSEDWKRRANDEPLTDIRIREAELVAARVEHFIKTDGKE